MTSRHKIKEIVGLRKNLKSKIKFANILGLKL